MPAVILTQRSGARGHAGHATGRTAAFTVDVRYAGTPQVVTDPDGSIEGWVPTDDGAFVVGEPQGSPGWFPANDTPTDKAAFDFTVTVPRGITVMANGVLAREEDHGDRDDVALARDRPDGAVPRDHDPRPLRPQAVIGRRACLHTWRWTRRLHRRGVLDRLPAIVRFYSSVFGPYPFNAVGAVVDRAPQVGYALETQTKPVFDSMPDEATLAHELAHQWYGDSVTLSTWPDIWLNEGFATWAEWLWSEHRGTKTAHDIFTDLYATPARRPRSGARRRGPWPHRRTSSTARSTSAGR